MSEHDVHVSRKPAVEIFFCRHFVKIAARGQTTPRARGRRFPIKLTLQFSSSTITQSDAHAAPALPAPPYRAGGVALSAPAVFRLPLLSTLVGTTTSGEDGTVVFGQGDAFSCRSPREQQPKEQTTDATGTAVLESQFL